MQSVATPSHVARRPAVRGILILFGVLIIVIGAAVLFAVMPRLARQKTLLAESRADSVHVPMVIVSKVKRDAAIDVLELPGNLLALNEAPTYARADGYMSQRMVDIGYSVKQGQLMAELDTPELDQQIVQAQAALSQAQAAVKQNEAALVHSKANLALAKVTLERWKRLSEHGVFSKQEQDEKQANYDVLEADVASADANLAAAKNAVSVTEANVKRLQELKAFSHIRAPFDGVITGRFVDVGTLVTAGANREMFRVAQIDPLRIFVSVPQAFVDPVRAIAGKPAELRVQQLPGRVFQSRVARSNSALDPGSRTMLTVLYVPNPKGELLPGMYGYVKFKLAETFKPLVVPGDTVVSRSTGPHVAVVSAQGKVQMRHINPGRDFGSRMEVLDGVTEGESVIVNPTDEIRDGVQVQIQK